MSPNSIFSLVLLASSTLSASSGTYPKNDLKAGVLRGKVVDLAGKPVANATVALEQPGGKVLSWAKTDANGEYSLSADPKLALNLRPSHCRGLLEECVRAAGGAVMEAVRVVGSTVLTPGVTVRSGAVAVASGTPGGAVVQGTAGSVPTAAAAPGQVGQAAAGAATDSALVAHKGAMPDSAKRGQANLLITAPGYKDSNIADAAYWMDPPSGDKKNPVGVQAWMQTIQIAPTAGDKKCAVVPAAITLSALDVQPTLVPVGGDIQIKVKLNSPDPGTESKIRVFARLASKGTVVELMPISGQKDVFGAKMTVDPKTPPGQTVLSVGALRAEPVEVRLNNKKSDPLIAFAGRVDDMNGSKPYGYDPFVMASVNRMDVKVTVLAAKTP